jgi:ABC-type multidrug transport system fused ATPase/permease subunit
LKAIVIDHLLEVRGSLLFSVLCMAGYTLTELAAPWPLKIIFDHLLLDRSPPGFLSWLSPLLARGRTTAIVVIAGSIVLIALFRGLFALFANFHHRADRARDGLPVAASPLRTFQQLSLSFHARARTGELLTRVVSDTSALEGHLRRIGPQFCRAIH